MKLPGKVALITGAGRGIGYAIATAFLREGAHVVANYRRSQAGAEEIVHQAQHLGLRSLAIRADISRRSEVQGMIDQTLQAFGRLDILVNNASVYSKVPLFDVTEDLWDQVLDTNLKGTFWCIQAAATPMLKQRSGVILNFASGAGIDPRPGFAASLPYASSRAAVVMMSKWLALTLAPYIRVNCVVPGIVDSKPKGMKEEVKRRFASVAPLNRVGFPPDITSAVVFLASEEAAFITGQTLVIDGGIIMH